MFKKWSQIIPINITPAVYPRGVKIVLSGSRSQSALDIFEEMPTFLKYETWIGKSYMVVEFTNKRAGLNVQVVYGWEIQLAIRNFITLTTFLYQMSSASLWMMLNTLTMKMTLGLILVLEHAPKHIHRSFLVQEGYGCHISSEKSASKSFFRWTLASHCNWSPGFLDIRHLSGDARRSKWMPLSLPYGKLR